MHQVAGGELLHFLSVGTVLKATCIAHSIPTLAQRLLLVRQTLGEGDPLAELSEGS